MRPDDPRLKNLVPLQKGDERTRRIASAGGKASKKAQVMRGGMQKIATLMLNQKLPESEKARLQKLYKNLNVEEISVQAAVVHGQIQAAIKGSSQAFEALLDLQQREQDKQEAEAKKRAKGYHIDLNEVGDAFHSTMRSIRNGEYLEYVEYGGRGSLKSSFFGQAVVEVIENNPTMHGICFRKVANTLKDSVYAQVKWAIETQGLEEDYECKANPLEITKKSTGQKIYFRGADKPEKIKSIKAPFGYIGAAWFEELDQFTEEEVRNIVQSVIRGGDKAFIFKSFNPPKSRDSWANQYVLMPKDNAHFHKSSYLEAPREWLGTPFLEEAEHLKKVRPEAYEHEYLGEANAAGGAVFTQLELRTIADDEIDEFDNIFQGVDWGLAPDPFAFVRLHYDRDRETIYFIDEYVERGLRNVQTAEEILKRQYDDFPITCDSAEKKSVLDYRDLGLQAFPARKGAGSREYGFKWLAGRKIIIDPKRTPYAAEEFAKYEFARDKDGNLICGYPDGNDHTIDATRYALEKYYNKRYDPA